MSFAPSQPFARLRLSGLRLGLLLVSCGVPFLCEAPILLAQHPAVNPGALTPATQQAPTATQQPATFAQQQHQQQVQGLINRAQASYASGVNNFNANRLDAARSDFDNAVDLMLSSGMDLKGDPQLADAFEHLLDSINSLEVVALKQGNGFSPKLEETPLEASDAEVTFGADPALVNRVTNELKTTKSDLPLTVNDYVAGFISYYTNSPKGHAYLMHSLARAGKYQAMIAKDLRDAGLPQDLIYLAVAESGFQPQVVNRSSGAGGMWQFMPFQGAYGLARNGYFDERFDPEKSSLAYARYMKYLYATLGDWYLAMAGYNWGPGNVQRAVQRTGYADFWELYRHNALPTATKNYVPGILAAAIMAKNPQQYGLTDLVPDAPVLSDTVSVSYAIDLRLVADLTGASVPEIVALNPALLRLSTPRDITYDLHIPPGTRDAYNTRLKDIPEEDRGSWRFHVVRTGENLESVAEAFHARSESIAAYNDVTAAQPLEAGDELVIPISNGGGRALGQQRYTPHRGDTLVTVADRFGVSVEDLRQWNESVDSDLRPGHAIYVAEPVHLAPSARRRGRVTAASRTEAGSARAGHHGAAASHGIAAGRGKAGSRAGAAGHAGASGRAGSTRHAIPKSSASTATHHSAAAHVSSPSRKHHR